MSTQHIVNDRCGIIELCNIFKHRSVGHVRFSIVTFYEGDDINIYLEKLGLFPEKENLKEISHAEAVGIVAHLLWKDMAFKNELMLFEKAVSFSEHLFKIIHRNCNRYFTNGPWVDYMTKEYQGYNSFTTSSCDGGIVFLTGAIIGCFWVEDED